MTWRSGLVAASVVAALLGCAGPTSAGGTPTVRRVDISHVDGVSCMAEMKGSEFVPLDQPYDLAACGPRTREGYVGERDRQGGFRAICEVAWGSECCSQGGGEIVGWEYHLVDRHWLASPLCLYR